MISLDEARTMVSAARKKGREMGLKPLSVVVLDAGGHVLAFEREDGASPGRFEIARGKAYGAVMLGMA
ncbi:MAG: heme-binding protein, partial [Roseicyclus sp.]